MANISGYRAIVEAANAFPRFFAGKFLLISVLAIGLTACFVYRPIHDGW
jgi:NAD/NADP transhydrogenase alpha subunit